MKGRGADALASPPETARRGTGTVSEALGRGLRPPSPPSPKRLALPPCRCEMRLGVWVGDGEISLY